MASPKPSLCLPVRPASGRAEERARGRADAAQSAVRVARPRRRAAAADACVWNERSCALVYDRRDTGADVVHAEPDLTGPKVRDRKSGKPRNRGDRKRKRLRKWIERGREMVEEGRHRRI